MVSTLTNSVLPSIIAWPLNGSDSEHGFFASNHEKRKELERGYKTLEASKQDPDRENLIKIYKKLFRCSPHLKQTTISILSEIKCFDEMRRNILIENITTQLQKINDKPREFTIGLKGNFKDYSTSSLEMINKDLAKKIQANW